MLKQFLNIIGRLERFVENIPRKTVILLKFPIKNEPKVYVKWL
jgi:hypothetical protein